MPNITLTIYVTDKDYSEKYLPDKFKINEAGRKAVRKEMGLGK